MEKLYPCNFLTYHAESKASERATMNVWKWQERHVQAVGSNLV